MNEQQQQKRSTLGILAGTIAAILGGWAAWRYMSGNDQGGAFLVAGALVFAGLAGLTLKGGRF